MAVHCKAHISISGQWILSTAPKVLDRRPESQTYDEKIIWTRSEHRKNNSKMEKMIIWKGHVHLPRQDSGR